VKEKGSEMGAAGGFFHFKVTARFSIAGSGCKSSNFLI
jgi:hypothetical protein